MQNSKLGKLSNFIGGIVRGSTSEKESVSNSSSAHGDEVREAPSEVTVTAKGAVAMEKISEEGTMDAIVSVEAPTLETEEVANRPPLDIIAVIDRSGSMSSEGKLELVKQTIAFLLQQLKSTDRVSLVTFDDKVKKEFGLTKVDKKGLSMIEEKVKSLQCGGTTNLCGGLVEGLQIAKARPEKEKKDHTSCVFLFTDGLANVGASTTEGVLSAIDNVGDSKAPSIYTFGYGNSHNEEMLKRIAEAANGLYYFLEDADKIPESFSDALGGLLSVVMQNTTVHIEAAEGCEITEVRAQQNAKEVKKGKVFEVELGDVFSEEKKTILLAIKYPKTKNPATTSLFSCKANFFDVVTLRQSELSDNCQLERVDRELTEEEKKPDVEVEATRMRFSYIDEVKQSRLEADRGDYESARNRMEGLKGRLKASPAANDRMMKRMHAETEAYSSMLSKPQVWAERGSKYAAAQAYTHQVQRGHQEISSKFAEFNELPMEAQCQLRGASSEVYMNKKKSAMKSKMSSFFG